MGLYLEESAHLMSAATIEGNANHCQAPHESASLCTPVSALYEAYSSDYTLSKVLLGA
jgi:hypothetical protein